MLGMVYHYNHGVGDGGLVVHFTGQIGREAVHGRLVQVFDPAPVHGAVAAFPIEVNKTDQRQQANYSKRDQHARDVARRGAGGERGLFGRKRLAHFFCFLFLYLFFFGVFFLG